MRSYSLRCSSRQPASLRGVVCISFRLPSRSVLTLFVRIVEFDSQEDSQRAIRELSEQPLLGRPMFIREVRSSFLLHSKIDVDLSTSSQDRENESRFGAKPVPGKMGMAMAGLGQGLTAGPPRPAYHNSLVKIRVISSMLEM